MERPSVLDLIAQAAEERWEELDLSEMGLSEIPPAIGTLSNLSILDLQDNQITVIPDFIANLSNLSTLYLQRNQITVIPDFIGNLSNLSALYLASNQITVIPNSITNLSNLSFLHLENNQITVIPDSIANLSNLSSLDLGNNQITVIPDSIANLSDLSNLHLVGNQITVIPDSITNLSNLSKLYLVGNQITVIPDSIANLSNLSKLYLWGNQITVIPDWISQLVNLKTLNLAQNLLRELPQSLTRLEQLEILRLVNNPLSIPPETLRQGWGTNTRDPGDPSAILNYCRNIQDPDQTQTLYEVKLLLVGEGGSGKTSLANKLLDPNYQLKPEAEDTSTKGIDILKWEFIGQNGEPYRINLWDFGGQEIYHQTHQFFLTERSLYLLVADSRKEDTDHYFWLKSIQILSDDSPVLLIQNEKQNRECNLNFKQLRGEFENLQDTHHLNLADNRGLPELQRALQLELEKLLPNGIRFPNKWLAVRYALTNDGLNYIDCTTYEQTCRRNGITDRQEMFQLSQFLHDLGICLHFQKDALLRHYLILKPNWGTAAVYKILDNETVRQNRGQFNNDNLEEIWIAEYAEMRDQLLQLMKAFKVCYEIPRRKGQYIAPHLLSADSPSYTWQPERNLILRYRYKGFMPKGILTRFIVEMHQDIENVSNPEQALVWKSGVILTNHAARAQVIESYAKREITIRVFGNRPRDLLTIINRKFEEIHKDFDDRLDYDTLIPCNCSGCKQSQNPFTFPLDRLYQFIDKGWPEIQCQEHNAQVKVRSLIDGIIIETNDHPEGHEIDDREDFPYKSHRPTGQRKRDRPRRDQPTVNIALTVPINNTNQQEQAVSNDKIWQGDRINGDKVMGDKDTVAGNKMKTGDVVGDAIAGNKIVNTQNMTQTAQDIKVLVNQYANDYDTTTQSGKMGLSGKVIESVEKNPTLKSRTMNALKEAGKTAFEEAIDHPVAKVLVAGLEGFME